MSNFEDLNNISREKFVVDFARKLKLNPELKKEQIRLINSQILTARDFYKRLIKIDGGYEIIIKKFNISNKNILKRLKKISSNNKEKLIERENKKFEYL